MGSSLVIRPLARTEEKPYDLLLLADPDKEKINQYLSEGDGYVLSKDHTQVGVIVLQALSDQTMEIKNIAVAAEMRGRGYGRMILEFAEKISCERGFQKLQIATANSSIVPLALYQKQGFDMVRLIRNFFSKNYSKPLVEDGIPCRHLIVLEKKLTSCSLST